MRYWAGAVLPENRISGQRSTATAGEHRIEQKYRISVTPRKKFCMRIEAKFVSHIAAVRGRHLKTDSWNRLEAERRSG